MPSSATRDEQRSINQTACKFFQACQTDGDWQACKVHCHDGASVTCQSDALAEWDTQAGENHVDKCSLGADPDGRCGLRQNYPAPMAIVLPLQPKPFMPHRSEPGPGSDSGWLFRPPIRRTTTDNRAIANRSRGLRDYR